MQQERMKPQKPLGSILDLKMAKQKPLAGMTSPLEPPAVCTPPSGQAKLQNLQVSFALAYFMHVRGGALHRYKEALSVKTSSDVPYCLRWLFLSSEPIILMTVCPLKRCHHPHR